MVNVGPILAMTVVVSALVTLTVGQIVSTQAWATRDSLAGPALASAKRATRLLNVAALVGLTGVVAGLWFTPIGMPAALGLMGVFSAKLAGQTRAPGAFASATFTLANIALVLAYMALSGVVR